MVDGSCGLYQITQAANWQPEFMEILIMFSRSEALLGKDNLIKLKNSHIVLCGCGGVGSYALEALVRTGIGKITVIDSDKVDITNINRQIIATHDTIGQSKVSVAHMRAVSINPDIEFVEKSDFLTFDNIEEIIPSDANYVIDAIDFVPAKVGLALFSQKTQIPLISCLGTGKRLDATKFEFCDIYKTEGCPLARKMRYELKKYNIKKLTVLISKAEAFKTEGIGSVVFVPAVAGLLLAQKVIHDIIKEK